ncbi:RNA polymerase sigma factor [uncultured Pseudoflavonifractor sp.]|uniref:RNA polymerase sigma factor n=1 Tax=uncultured Pseudoflavonifractor sp. TaxID=1221379 RepID=UPI0025F4851D|nr:RNA polymerase sigma factor [uncultured Pseudoflavonifractor sp.]
MIYLQMIETPDEQSKFELLYLKYRGLMFHVAFNILHNRQDAEDAVHHAFVKIAENMKKIGDPMCPQTHSFVVTIVEHRAIDQYRQLQKHPTVELIDGLPGAQVEYDGDKPLAACILALPARYRRMILLHYHQGYSVREIAKMLGMSLSAAIKLDQRAKHKLKSLCEREGIF